MFYEMDKSKRAGRLGTFINQGKHEQISWKFSETRYKIKQQFRELTNLRTKNSPFLVENVCQNVEQGKASLNLIQLSDHRIELKAKATAKAGKVQIDANIQWCRYKL